MHLIQTNFWSHTCSIGFMSEILAGQHVTTASTVQEEQQLRVQFGNGLSQSCTQSLESSRVAIDPTESQCSKCSGGSWCNPGRPGQCSSNGGVIPTPSQRDYHFHQLAVHNIYSSSTLIRNLLMILLVVSDLTKYRIISILRRGAEIKLFPLPSRASGSFSPWWRHQMETLSALLAICAGNSPVPGRTKASNAELWCFLLSAPE